MKQLTFSFLCLLLGSVLVCTSFVMAAGSAAAEGIIQDEGKGAQEAILAPVEPFETSTLILPLPEETKPPEPAWVTVTATAYCPCENAVAYGPKTGRTVSSIPPTAPSPRKALRSPPTGTFIRQELSFT